jgi:hypothetical protein
MTVKNVSTEFFFRRRKRMVRSKSLESSRFYGFIGWRTGLRRGRTHPDKLHEGDALDFWRVLYANKEEGKLILLQK